MVEKGKEGFQTFLEGGCLAVQRQFSVDQKGLSLADYEDVAALVSSLHRETCRDICKKRRLRTGEGTGQSGQNINSSAGCVKISLGSIEAVLCCGVAEPAQTVGIGLSGRALGKVTIPPNLFHRLDSFLRQLKAKPRNRLFKRHKLGSAVIYSILNKELAEKAFRSLGVTGALFKFLSKRGLSFEGKLTTATH